MFTSLVPKEFGTGGGECKKQYASYLNMMSAGECWEEQVKNPEKFKRRL